MVHSSIPSCLDPASCPLSTLIFSNTTFGELFILKPLCQKHTKGASTYPCPGMHSEPCQHRGLPLAYTSQGIPRSQSHKSQLRGCAVCMSSVNSTTSLRSKTEFTQLKKTCLLRGPLMLGCVLPCGWDAWSVACILLRESKMQSVMGVLSPCFPKWETAESRTTV